MNCWPTTDASDSPAVGVMARYGLGVPIRFLSSPGGTFQSASGASHLHRTLNTLVADLIRTRSRRFGGFAALPISGHDASLHQLSYSSDDLPFDGVGLLSNCDGTYLGSRSFDSISTDITRGFTGGRRREVGRDDGSEEVGDATVCYVLPRLMTGAGVERAGGFRALYGDLAATIAPGRTMAPRYVANAKGFLIGFDVRFVNASSIWLTIARLRGNESWFERAAPTRNVRKSCSNRQDQFCSVRGAGGLLDGQTESRGGLIEPGRVQREANLRSEAWRKATFEHYWDGLMNAARTEAGANSWRPLTGLSGFARHLDEQQ